MEKQNVLHLMVIFYHHGEAKRTSSHGYFFHYAGLIFPRTQTELFAQNTELCAQDTTRHVLFFLAGRRDKWKGLQTNGLGSRNKFLRDEDRRGASLGGAV